MLPISDASLLVQMRADRLKRSEQKKTPDQYYTEARWHIFGKNNYAHNPIVGEKKMQLAMQLGHEDASWFLDMVRKWRSWRAWQLWGGELNEKNLRKIFSADQSEGEDSRALFFRSVLSQNKKDQRHLLEEAVAKNPANYLAVANLGGLLYSLEQYRSVALKLLQDAADHGSIFGCFRLGRHYQDQDQMEKALFWMKKSARKGSSFLFSSSSSLPFCFNNYSKGMERRREQWLLFIIRWERIMCGKMASGYTILARCSNMPEWRKQTMLRQCLKQR
jgi:hypothetical protein